MNTVNTVLGPVSTANLGFTLMHEHLLNSGPGLFQNYPELYGTGPLERIVSRLVEAKVGGVRTIVDATTFDTGREVALQAEASRRSGVNIIAASGWWRDELPRRNSGISIDQFARLFVREIQVGMAGTSIKAGILKAASDMPGVTPWEEHLLRAVARAHLQTNVPIMLHSYSPEQVGRQQVNILKQEGVDLRRVKIDHCTDTCDVEYLVWLADQGCYLGMDRFPGEYLRRKTSTVARLKTLKAMIDGGYQDRLLLSHDYSPTWFMPEKPNVPHEKREASNPHGYLYLKNVLFARLREMGVSESTLASLCMDNPRRFFEGS